jgi:hypothetical protein
MTRGKKEFFIFAKQRDFPTAPGWAMAAVGADLVLKV